MAAAPVHSETIPFKAAAFDKFPVRAAIDRGCSLTKVAFVPKDAAATDPDMVPLRCLTFRNADFEDALRAMKAQAQLPESGEIHVTGVGCATYKDTIKKIIGLDTLLIAENGIRGRGAFLLINNARPEDVFHPKPEVTDFKMESAAFQKFLSSTKEAGAEEEEEAGALFPALVLHAGSSAVLMKVSKDGATKAVRSIGLSGRPFLGLAKLLVGTNDYDEVMELAGRGDQSKVDLVVRDLMGSRGETPYGHFASDLAVFNFAKASMANWRPDQCGREDIARSLVSFFAGEMCYALFATLTSSGLSRVYLTGGFFRDNIVQRLLIERMMVFCGGLKYEMKALRTDHAGPVAAMLCCDE